MIVIRGEGMSMDTRPCDFSGTTICNTMCELEAAMLKLEHRFKEVTIGHAKTNSNANIKPQWQRTNVGVVGVGTTPPSVTIGEPQEWRGGDKWWDGYDTSSYLTPTTAEQFPLLEPIPVREILSLDFIKVNVK